MHKLFESLAKAIIEEYSRKIKNSLSHYNRATYIREMKVELEELKLAYGVVYVPVDSSEQIFDINTSLSLH